MRKCSKCGVVKPAEAYHAYHDKRTKDGLRSKCKECTNRGGKPGPDPVGITTRYTIQDSGCWLWDGPPTKRGYGSVKFNGKTVGAHVAMYRLVVGDYPKGLVLDHLCNVKRCVNPAHLEPVTHQENIRRAWSRVGNHCATCTCTIKIAPTTDVCEVPA